MDLPVLKELLTAIKDAVSGSRLNDSEVALPIFDPAKSDLGAESWCNNIETLAKEFGWSNVATVAKAGKALKGSALLWFETWDPAEGRSWDNLRLELVALYPEKKNLAEKLQKAVLYTSETADSYCEYAREKIRLLKNTKIVFTELQLIELVCGSICDVNVKMASFNSNVKTTSELIALFTSYAKTKKRSIDSKDPSNLHPPKRFKTDFKPNEIKCFNCGKTGHTKQQCYSRKSTQNNDPNSEQGSNNENRKFCTYCKKPGHLDSYCRYKPKTDPSNTDNQINFLDKAN
ncbi:uncharacterized protein LOC118271158 [Spodoptera frugiperda]|uniref:Uncharacterized protein LOC118271158 n=1 Tax=Spodoptera frugiperda TaxID=7108 RepID=A0A9R0ELD5_SPOFR|nr:uncharacterized protein LOC118271158 [Spodoptera frugiperda]